jgi:hypothetical protein
MELFASSILPYSPLSAKEASLEKLNSEGSFVVRVK